MLAAAIAVCFGVGAGNAVAFGAEAQELQLRWTALEQAGVPSSDLAPLRERLDRLEARRLGPLPYSAVSGGLFENPLDAVVLGAGKCVDNIETLNRILVTDNRR